jgi:hypothetical protein
VRASHSRAAECDEMRTAIGLTISALNQDLPGALALIGGAPDIRHVVSHLANLGIALATHITPGNSYPVALLEDDWDPQRKCLAYLANAVMCDFNIAGELPADLCRSLCGPLPHIVGAVAVAVAGDAAGAMLLEMALTPSAKAMADIISSR